MKDYTRTPEERAAMLAEVVAAIADGTIKSNITREYELAEIATAHADMDARRTTGATVVTFAA
jgi:NADPH2:quinone reductase